MEIKSDLNLPTFQASSTLSWGGNESWRECGTHYLCMHQYKELGLTGGHKIVRFKAKGAPCILGLFTRLCANMHVFSSVIKLIVKDRKVYQAFPEESMQDA